jgi:hypothetical protein
MRQDEECQIEPTWHEKMRLDAFPFNNGLRSRAALIDHEDQTI